MIDFDRLWSILIDFDRFQSTNIKSEMQKKDVWREKRVQFGYAKTSFYRSCTVIVSSYKP